MTPLHKLSQSADPQERLRAASVTWMRDGACQHCGKPALTGYLDGRPIAHICTDGCEKSLLQPMAASKAEPRV